LAQKFSGNNRFVQCQLSVGVGILLNQSFLRRVWDTDKNVLRRDMQQLVNGYPKNYYFTLFLSCEGTRYTDEKRIDSMEIARQKNLPELKHHILPRTKGFVLLMQGMHKQVTGVYDVNVAFQTPKNPELSNLLVGHPCHAEAFVRRIPTTDIPYEDEQKCAQFIHTLFQEKDKIFEHFLRHGTFAGAGNPVATNLGRKIQDLVIEIVCICIVGLPSLYFMIKFLLTASLRLQLVFLIFVLAGIIGVRLMIRTSSRPKLDKNGTKQQ